jgi:membrane-associated phospholipid phosphatase
MFQINNRLYYYQRSAAAIRILTALALASLMVFVYSVDDLHAQQTSATDRTVAFKPCLFSKVAKVEPDAGTWKTWVLQSPDQVRIGAPPYAPDDIAELRRFELARNDSTLDQVLFWDSGGPSYRWNEIALNETVRANLNNVRYSRVMALVNVALYDAIIAAWESKYLHRRPRPVECTPSLTTLIDTPQSPSYPSAYAAAAGAASTVLAYLFPSSAQAFAAQAQQAAESRIHAGVNYRSDVTAGLELGRAVGALVVEYARNDGSNAVFMGSQPTGPCNWNGTNPLEPAASTWRTWVLASPSEVRPGPPPACGTAAFAQELAAVRDFARPIPATAATLPTTRAAYFWQANVARLWNDLLAPKIFEYNLDANPPRAARAYALFHIAAYDSTIACWDAKYFYWFIRPSQFDPAIRPLFAVPNHPSYPSAHAIYDGSYAEVLSYLFPRDEEFFRARALEAGNSRLWAGIHYQVDIDAGLALSREVGRKVIALAKNDGSH